MDVVIVFLAKYLIFLIFLITLTAVFTDTKRKTIILSMILAGFLALDLSAIAGALYYNPRPFVVDNIVPLIEHGADNGFPSMHTVLGVTLASVVLLYNRRLGVILLALALSVGAGRVWAHVHSWLDIAGGLVVGAIAAYAGVKIAGYLLKRFSARPREGRRLPREQPKNIRR
jgi:undecaprenyl-diphosphatase